jgi:hypothetical protein
MKPSEYWHLIEVVSRARQQQYQIEIEAIIYICEEMRTWYNFGQSKDQQIGRDTMIREIMEEMEKE